MILRLIVGVMSEEVTCTHVLYFPRCRRMHVRRPTEPLSTQSLGVIRILTWGLESNHYKPPTMGKVTTQKKKFIPVTTDTSNHRWELPVIRYNRIIAIYSKPF